MSNSKIIGQNVRLKEREVNQFLSVPYAQPPIGKLRFKKPEPIQNYPKEIYAFNLPPACHQYSGNTFSWFINSTYKSEDCLYLNIWTPSDASPANRKAVLYWIHGGGFKYGSIQLPLYSGIPLAALGDIIVVTVNYRVGPFGFLTSGTRDAPGNVGVWDILEGLRWVNKYIGYFGGDTSRITIAGESAGSWAVGLLAVSPLAKGLYKRQIMESGSPVFLAAENNTQNLAFSQRLAEMVGCATPRFTVKDNPVPVLECLRRVDAVQLSKVDYSLNPYSVISFIPQYGDEIVPLKAKRAIMEGDFHFSELLIGNNKDEGSFLLSTAHPEVFGFFGEKDTSINKSVGADFIRKAYEDESVPESVVQHYLPDAVPEHAGAFVRNQTFTSFGDMLVLCPDVYHAEKCTQIGGNVYYYYWNHRPSNTPWAPWLGVAHFTEVQFVFGSPLLDPSSYTQKEQRISQQMIEI
ncbi:Acetylcholinesterase-1 [Araneus ventricosus]|uniref:Carboxylic ester hydrolase n=1 Tax=Araneus ventricosus TaxID=182803 RepID=A0A4Y2IJE8_ARAVE|nr:Acetylcholinesterase-1 [Araneus ventricosus]